MRRILSEKNLVVVLFVIVIVCFALAQEDAKKIERMYQNSGISSTSLPDETLQPKLGKTEGIAIDLPGIQHR